MILNEYYVCDSRGYIKEKVFARTLLNELQSDGCCRWTLKNVDGSENLRVEKGDESFCHKDCWANPDDEFTDTVRKGAEKEFEFFMKHGYHMP